MDSNLTLAHITHNAAVILLHQAIAYPPFTLEIILSQAPLLIFSRDMHRSSV